MFKLFFVIILFNIGQTMGQTSSESDYVDPIIDLLLNGPNSENESIDVKEDDPIMNGGIWKCGNCTDISNSELVYTETNDVVENKAGDHVDMQISLSLQGMRCVTVLADTPGVVRKVSGACDADMVTLHVASARQYIIQVYN